MDPRDLTNEDYARAMGAWRAAGLGEPYASDMSDLAMFARAVAERERIAAEARGRAAERERCAGTVREMAAKLDEAGVIDDEQCDCRGCNPHEYACRDHARDLRDLAERIGKGE